MKRSIFALCALLLAAATARADDEAVVRADLQRLLDSMAAAATAGDTDAYLASVDPSDREFAREQRYFANDLHRAPPETARFTLDPTPLQLGDGTADATLVLEWNMPHKTTRKVSEVTRFVRVDGDWKYAGEVWHRVERPAASGTVTVMFDEGLEEVAARTAEAFESVRAGVEDGFSLADSPLARRNQKIKLYSTMRHLQASICLAYEESLSGWNEPGESIKLLVNKGSAVGALKRLLAHEYAHVATFELGPRSNDMPWWILEGAAEFSASGFKGDGGVRMLSRLESAGSLAPWDQLADFHSVPGKWRGHVYFQGHGMIAYVDHRFGKDKRVEWLKTLSAGTSLDEGTKASLGIDFSTLDKEWRAMLDERAKQNAAQDEADKPDAKDNTRPSKPGTGEAPKNPDAPK